MKKRLIALACGLASTALAQIGGEYLGPAVLTNGATGVGNRSGQQVDLRFFAGVNGVYDSSVQPVAIDSKGNLVTLKGLVGVDATFGVYGTHAWQKSTLGIDYNGTFRAYSGNASSDGIDQSLHLGYTWQESKRVILNSSLSASIYSNALNGIATTPLSIDLQNAPIINPGTLLFDNRSYSLQGSLGVTLMYSPRTSFSFSGQGFDVIRQSSQLVGVEGWGASGTMQHSITRSISVGFTYQHQHYEFPGQYGQSDVNMGELFMATNLGPNWSLTVLGGVSQAQVQGLQSVTLSPVVAALLGQSQSIQAFYSEDIFPSGQVSLHRRFRSSSLGFYFGRSVSPGNGVYLTSRSDSGGAGYSYSGIRKASLSISGGYSRLSSIGQGIQPYTSATAGVGFTYTLPYSLHFVARYDYRYQAIENFAYKNTGYAATIGLSYSPGKVPLSLW